MPPLPSVFLSYARDDDKPFVRRLYEDLTARGFDVWFDRVSMPARQLSFTQEIKEAIAARDRVVLVVGPEAAVRPYVLKEWREALLMDKCVNPIVRLDGHQADGTRIDGYTLIPEELSFIHANDFRRDAEYAEHFENLVRQLSDPAPPLGKLVAVPTLPSHYRAQPDRLRRLRDALLIDLRGPVVVTGAAARMGVQGMGGIGKSVLANALTRDLQVRRAFPDGIFWIPVGQQPTIVELQRQVATALGDEALFNDVRTGKETLRALLANRAALLVLDDVWRRGDADAFDVFGPRCKLLLTTRDAGLVISMAGTHYQVQLPTEAEALALLASAGQVAVELLPALAADVARECGRLPLALALCGGMVQMGTSWGDLLDALREHDLEFLSDAHAAEDQHRNVWRAMEVSVRALSEEQQQRFAELAVFAVGARVPEAAVLTLWAHTGGLTERYARRLLVELNQRSLVQLGRRTEAGVDESATVGLHDLLHDFATRLVGQRFGTVASLHEQLLEAYHRTCSNDWPSGPNDGYFFDHLRDHLIEAGRVEELCWLLLDFAWLEKKAGIGLVFDLPRDYAGCLRACPAHNARRRNIRLLEQALRRDIHFIARHPTMLFQCLWNSGWWYDHSESESHYLPPQQPPRRPGHSLDGPKLHVLLDAWRGEQERRSPPRVWLRTLRPPAVPLGTAQRSVLRGHKEVVRSVAWSPDGRLLASASQDFTVRVWSAESGEEMRCLRAGTYVWSTAWSPDGHLLVSGSEEKAYVWDAETGQERFSLVGHEHRFLSVVWAPDGHLIASASPDGTVRVWDGLSGAERRCFRWHGGSVGAVAWSPDGRFLAGAQDETVRVWDAQTGDERLRIRNKFPLFEKGVAWSPDGRFLASTSQDETVRVWDAQTGDEQLCIRHKISVRGVVAWSPDGRFLASAQDETVRVWDAQTGDEWRCLRGHDSSVSTVAWSPDGRFLASGSADKTVRVWDAEMGDEPRYLPQHEGYVVVVAWSPDGRFLASGSEGNDNTVRVWSADKGGEQRRFRGHKGSVWKVAWSPDGRFLASTSDDKTLRVWELATGQEKKCLVESRSYFWSVAWSPDGRLLASGSGDQSLRVWDTDTGKELCRLRGHEHHVGSVAWSPDGRFLTSGSNDKTVRVWVVAKGKQMLCLSGHESSVNCVACSPDGRFLASASDDETVRVWDVQTGEERHRLRGHGEPVSTVAWSPGGRFLVSMTNDVTLRVWDAETGVIVATLQGFAEVAAVARAFVTPGPVLFQRDRELVLLQIPGEIPLAWFEDTAEFHRPFVGCGRNWAGHGGNKVFILRVEGTEGVLASKRCIAR